MVVLGVVDLLVLDAFIVPAVLAHGPDELVRHASSAPSAESELRSTQRSPPPRETIPRAPAPAPVEVTPVAPAPAKGEAANPEAFPPPLPDVLFPEMGQSTVPSESLEELARAVRCLAERPELVLHVRGHTDAIGGEQHNRELGLRRARRVAEVLRALGAPTDRVETSSAGEDEPVAQGASPEDWARNRRVQFLFSVRGS